MTHHTAPDMPRWLLVQERWIADMRGRSDLVETILCRCAWYVKEIARLNEALHAAEIEAGSRSHVYGYACAQGLAANADHAMGRCGLATSCCGSVGELATRSQRELIAQIIAAEIRFAQHHELLLEAAKLVLTSEPIDIAGRLREVAERTIRPTGRATES